MRKNNLLSLILIVLLLGSTLSTYILYSNNNNLTSQINQRDKLLIDAEHRDSLFLNQTKRYSDTINKYTSDCDFIVEGKTINKAGFVKLVNLTFKENAHLQDSIYSMNSTERQLREIVRKYDNLLETCINERNRLRDTAHIYNKMYDMTKDRYGIEYQVRPNPQGFTFIKEVFAPADSGLLLLPYFRERLKRDGNQWTISH